VIQGMLGGQKKGRRGTTQLVSSDPTGC